MAIIKLENVTKAFDGTKPIICNVSLEIKDGDFVSIMGRSGSGKSTLMKIMCGLIKCDSGSVKVAEYDICNMTAKQRSVFRSQVIGIVFQDSNLIDDFNVIDNILAPCLIAHKKVDTEYFNRLVKITELGEHLNKMPSQLSGGQRQRVAIARALIARPKVLFADEPTGNLDSLSETKIMELFSQVNKEFGTTIVQVTHSNTCAKVGGTIITINDGKISGQK